jgi:hypothetical protein
MSEQDAAPTGIAARRFQSLPPARVGLAALALCVAALTTLLVFDDVASHRRADQASRQSQDLSRQLSSARADVGQLSSQLNGLRTDNSRLQGEARNPTLAMWNSCGGPCTIGPNSVRVGSVPDTFELLVNFTADTPIRTYFLTFHQWTQYDGCGFNTRCVTGPYTALDASMSLDQRFSEAEGCSGYVWVLQADHQGTIRPNVQIHYQPADHPTGVCAISP